VAKPETGLPYRAELVNNEPVPASSNDDNPRWVLAEKITDALRRRWPAEIHAVGVHGALAHGEDDGGELDLVVITYRPGSGPWPVARRVDGILVDLSVISADEYLGYARTLSTSWPLVADQYLTTKALYDPGGWHSKLRDTHLSRLAEAGGGEFATLAREAWCEAESSHARALRLAEWHDTDGALLTFGAAKLATALVDGLLSRTYFRDSADAVRRTGLGDTDLTTLGHKLREQAAELHKRGRPVDGTVDDLIGAG
jgi:hypothetical protein